MVSKKRVAKEYLVHLKPAENEMGWQENPRSRSFRPIRWGTITELEHMDQQARRAADHTAQLKPPASYSSQIFPRPGSASFQSHQGYDTSRGFARKGVGAAVYDPRYGGYS